jgi:diguanylate cyclase (GGDEF)-like protein
MRHRLAALSAVWGRRRATAHRRRGDAAGLSGRTVVRWVVGSGLALILGVVGAVGWTVNQHREHVLASAERELANTVLLLARHFEQKISQIRDDERDFIARIRAAGIRTPADFAREMASEQTHAMLQEKANTASDAYSIWIFDAEGNLLNSSLPDASVRFNVGGQSSFQALASPSSPPFKIELVPNHVQGGWLIVLAHRVTGPDGEFLGVVSEGITPETLERFFASVALGNDASITMFKNDGTLLARHPHVESMIGTNVIARRARRAQALGIRDESIIQLAQRDGKATRRFWSPFDTQDRLGAAQVLSGYPVTLVAATTVEAALAGWREQTRVQIGAAALSAAIIAAMLVMIVRQIHRQHRASRQRLGQEKRRLDTAINNMAQGLLMFDAAGRLIVCNRRYIDMFNMSDEIVKPGCTLRELTMHRKACGFFPGDVDAYIAWFEDQLRSGKPGQSTLEPGDGRTFQYMYQPLSDGGWLTTVEDITARRRAEERIAHLAHYDPLTDLPNRVLFRERLERELATLGDDGSCAVLYIDIDEFKAINDSLGHSVGDELLRTVARRIQSCIGSFGFTARLGGDEFAVVQRGANDPEAVAELVGRIYEVIRAPCECFGHQIATDASIGVAIAPQHGTELDLLLKHADLAMYAAKADGRRTWRLFEPSMDARVKTRQQLEQELRAIIATGDFAAAGFEVHYQPLVCLNNGEIAGCEALLRWNHPCRGPISPVDFIPVAEDSGLIVQLGEWVLTSACREAAHWPGNVKIAVNVSPIQFRSPTLALHVVSALNNSGLAPGRLELEITEAVLIRDDDTALSVLAQLRALGVRTALDDFGTGYSSLSYLQRFPFDKIKIDRAFVRDVAVAATSAAIVEAVVNIAATRDMVTTAEGVETEAQRDRLRALGCAQMQGYLFSPARPADEIRRLLAADARTAAA